MNITLTDASAFVITRRNEANSIFYIRPKADVVKEIENKSQAFSFGAEGFYPENEIIEMINKGKKFYTHLNNEFTEVIAVNNNIKSIPNNTTADNISKLPIIIAAEMS